MSNEELDKLFKNKFENREVPFDESAWEDAARLIDEQNIKPKRRIATWLLVLLLALGGSATTFWLINMNTADTITTKQDTITENTTTETEGNNTETHADKQDTEIPTPNNTNDITDKKQINQQEAPVKGKDNSAPTSKQPSLPDAGAKPPKTNKDISKEVGSKNPENASGGEDKGLNDNKTDKPDKTGGESQEIIDKQAEQQSENTDDKYTEEELKKMAEDAAKADTNYDVNIPVVDNVEGEIDSVVIANAEERDSLSEDEEPVEVTKAKKKSKDNKLDGVKHKLGLMLGFSNIKVFEASLKDSLLYTITPTNTDKVENQFQFGLAYTYSFNNRWSLSTGLLYYKRQVLNNNRQSNTTSYSFGYNSTTTYEVTNELTLLELPIMAEYNIFNKGYLQLGGGINFIINSKNTLLEYELGSFNNGKLTTTEVIGYTGGYNSTSYNFMLGYKHYVLPRLSLGVQMVSGLTDMTKDDVYNNTTFDRNMQYRVVLRYDIINFRNNKARRGHEY